MPPVPLHLSVCHSCAECPDYPVQNRYAHCCGTLRSASRFLRRKGPALPVLPASSRSGSHHSWRIRNQWCGSVSFRIFPDINSFPAPHCYSCRWGGRIMWSHTHAPLLCGRLPWNALGKGMPTWDISDTLPPFSEIPPDWSSHHPGSGNLPLPVPGARSRTGDPANILPAIHNSCLLRF